MLVIWLRKYGNHPAISQETSSRLATLRPSCSERSSHIAIQGVGTAFLPTTLRPKRARGTAQVYLNLVHNLDILAIAAHRDDVEQTCGGTLLKMAEQRHRTGILDLTQGEMGTRGSAEDRAREAAAAAKILKASWRSALDIPDARVENTWENRLKIALVIREQRPRVVILPYWQGRHPDHYTTSTLGYEACFLAGMSKLDLPGAPHRTFKIIYATLYYDIRPSFVVDITGQFEARPNAIYAY